MVFTAQSLSKRYLWDTLFDNFAVLELILAPFDPFFAPQSITLNKVMVLTAHVSCFLRAFSVSTIPVEQHVRGLCHTYNALRGGGTKLYPIFLQPKALPNAEAGHGECCSGERELVAPTVITGPILQSLRTQLAFLPT